MYYCELKIRRATSFNYKFGIEINTIDGSCLIMNLKLEILKVMLRNIGTSNIKKVGTPFIQLYFQVKKTETGTIKSVKVLRCLNLMGTALLYRK